MEIDDWISLAVEPMEWELVQSEMFNIVDITERLSLELLKSITDFIQGDFIAFTSTCKLLNSLNTQEQKEIRANTFLLLADEVFPEWKINGKLLSKSDYLCLEYISRNPQIAWDVKSVMKNPCISLADAKKLVGNNFQLIYYILNPRVSYQEALEIVDRTHALGNYYTEVEIVCSECNWFSINLALNPDADWNWKALSRKKLLNYYAIVRFIHADWDWEAIMTNPGTLLPQIEDFISAGRFDAYKNYIPQNPYITREFINKHPEIPWNTCRPVKGIFNFSVEDMYCFPHVNWDWDTSFKEHICPQAFAYELNILGLKQARDFIKYDIMPWSYIKDRTDDWFEAELRSDFISIFAENPNHSWNWNLVSGNANLSKEFFLRHINMPWDWEVISSRKFITFAIVKAYKSKPWNAKKLSQKKDRF